MKLTHRLALGMLLLVGSLVGMVVFVADRRLSDRLVAEAADDLSREAKLISVQWASTANAALLASSAGGALRHRVTLIDSTGRVVGDSRFAGEALAKLENHNTRPEVVAARRTGFGVARRVSASAGDEELYVAVRAPLGLARVSMSTRSLDDIIDNAQHDVLLAGLVALVIAVVLAYAFSRSVSGPIIALRDAARAVADGEAMDRPLVAAPGEVGELASAVHRMADQLTVRLAALEADEALLTALVESLTEGIVASDRRGRIIRINSSARRILGIDDVVPIPVRDIEQLAVRQALSHAVAGEPTAQKELQIRGRIIALTATPLTAAGGAVLALVDLTQVRRLEAVRRDFVANVSHELKTPLTVIGGFAETLVDDDVAEAQRLQFTKAIHSNARRMQRIVDDLLDLSRIESGGWRPDPVTIDVRSAASEALGAASDGAEQKGITIEVAPDRDAETLHADPTALYQVLSNLVENAVRHTARGSVTVFTRRVDGGTWLGVRDTGEGIAREHLSRIFERFYRVDPARSREAGGTGLGLAVVRHLVEAHGGTVRAESTVGAGTTMSAFFPDVGSRAADAARES